MIEAALGVWRERAITVGESRVMVVFSGVSCRIVCICSLVEEEERE